MFYDTVSTHLQN